MLGGQLVERYVVTVGRSLQLGSSEPGITRVVAAKAATARMRKTCHDRHVIAKGLEILKSFAELEILPLTTWKPVPGGVLVFLPGQGDSERKVDEGHAARQVGGGRTEAERLKKGQRQYGTRTAQECSPAYIRSVLRHGSPLPTPS